jgi:diadenosine tetraphosphate (Ap4A) HIT family hydrolase
VAIPTLGHLFPGYLLLVPKFHAERFADLDPSLSGEWKSLVQSYDVFLQSPTLVYEHGALGFSGGACGIYHAHIHIVPLPRGIHTNEIFGDRFDERRLFPLKGIEALNELRSSIEYLFTRDSFGEVIAATRKSATEPFFPSQFVRKRIVEIFNLSQPLDWRLSTPIEQTVLDTISHLGTRWRAHDHGFPL